MVEVFAVFFVGDYPAYVTMHTGPTHAPMPAAFGAPPPVLYRPTYYAEFVFKGPICKTLRSAEEWVWAQLRWQMQWWHLWHDVKFCFSKPFARWVSHWLADLFGML